MKTNRWHELLENLGVWKRRGEVAPHKPLLTLLLLARSQQGLSSQVAFKELDAPLKSLLMQFGPQRRTYHPEFPFWYLQNDGFWQVQNREFFERERQTRKGKTQPTKTALLHHHAVGEVNNFLWKQLKQEPELVPRLARSLLDQFWPSSLHDDIVSAVGLNMADTEVVTRKKRDPRFRHEVLRAYERKCAVCGYDARLGDALFGLEAAHIKWFQYSGPDQVSNGLALCSLHHKALDKGAIGMSDNRKILVSSELSGHETVRKTILDFNGQVVRGPQGVGDKPDERFVVWHRKNVFRGPARDW
jgi:putative restriction endonuclease